MNRIQNLNQLLILWPHLLEEQDKKARGVHLFRCLYSIENISVEQKIRSSACFTVGVY